MDCLDENKVLQYVGGFLGPKDRQALEEHVAACDECRWMLSAAGAAVLDEVPTGEPTAVVEAGLAEASAASRLNEVLQGTYVLERFIGRGGVGCVYEAAHRRLPRRFAVKLLDRKFVSNTNAVERLKREAEITSRLLHPSIVEVVDFNKAEDGTPFLVMELLQGESLARRLEREGVLQLDHIAAVVEQVASALAAAHARGVVHRDLKPSNIFLCPREGGGTLVKVVDFGIAKVLPRAPQPADGWRRAAITRIWQVIGTPSYMSPEQALGLSADVDHRADIFSLGAILFRMVSGSCPFSAASVEATLERVAEGRLEQNTRWREAPESLRTVILRALSKNPSQRQKSMTELWTELSAALAQAGISMSARTETAKRASPWMRFRVFAPVAAVGLAATVVVWAAFRSSVKPSAVEAVRAKQVKPGGPASSGPQAAKSLDSGPTANASAPAIRAVPISLQSAADREPFRPLRVRAHRFGSLVVQSKTKQDGRYLWADVFLDGRQVGQTALTLEKVPEGQHRVEVRRPGFAPAAREIRVSAGKRARVRFELERR